MSENKPNNVFTTVQSDIPEELQEVVSEPLIIHCRIGNMDHKILPTQEIKEEWEQIIKDKCGQETIVFVTGPEVELKVL